MVSVCLPSDALLQHLPSYLGFSYLGRGVSLHGCSSKVQPLLLALEERYLLTATLPDVQRGIAPLGPPAPAQPRLLGCGVGPPGQSPWSPDGEHRNQIDYILCSQRWRSPIQSAKTRPGADCGSDHELLIAKFRLKLKKEGKTFKPFRYDLNQIPYDYTVEVRNRFEGLDLIECLMNYGLRFVTLYKRQGSRPSPWKRNAKNHNGCLGRPYK